VEGVSLFFILMSEKLKILACPANEGGCAYYRVIAPYKKLEELYGDEVEVRWNKNPLGVEEKDGSFIPDWDFADMKWADVIVLNNLTNFGGNYTARIVGKGKEFGKFVHYDTDDLLTNLYEGHRLYGVYKDKGLSEITKFIYKHADLVTVTQRKFAERVAPYCDHTIAVVKNTIDYNLPCWNLPRIRPPRNKMCRFGWAGGIHHEQDVKYFAGVPHFVNQRLGRENCRWDFYGHPPPETPKDDWQWDVWKSYQNILMKGFKGGKNWDIHYALGPDRYGQFFTNMDVALAPLEPNEFNDSKSEIKVAECGRYKVPLVASNVGSYDEWIINGVTGYLIDPKKGRTEWIKTLTKIGKDKKHREEMGNNLYEIANENFDMNKAVGERLRLYRELMKEEPVESKGN